MGVVYKAQDTRLDRAVALKFLPEHLWADSSAKARFVHEAKGASAINHPNIATVHDIDEADGKSFIVMEYIEGKTLKELAQEGLKLNRALEIAIQAAEGLSAAHKKEIWHRDIKSDNIMLTKEDAVKIMDFGLAKLKGATKITATGSTLGTVAYMSPEQTKGEEIDQRSDIFSLGVVLYELITGRLPFEGEQQAAIVYSICYENPEPLPRYKSGVPEGLQRIVDKALKKDRNIRYQSSADLAADLRGVQREITVGAAIALPKRKLGHRNALLIGVAALLVISGYLVFSRFFASSTKPPESQRKMLAVLPFENLGPPEQEYFADGITDEITTNLAKVSGLGVISRTSAIQYKKTNKSLRQIGSELGVQYVLEGTVRWQPSASQSRVRVTPQLIRVSDDTHLWANVYDEMMSEVFTVQSDIAQKVTSALDVALLEPERKSLEARPTENLEAYAYYLQGNNYFYFSSPNKAVEMYQKAIDLDSDFALAYANLSRAHMNIYWSDLHRSDERLAKAKEAVDKAFQLQRDLPEAHSALGLYYYYGKRDYDRALEEYAIAQKNLPNNVDLFAEIGYIQRRQGKWEKAVANIKKATELDPRSLRYLNGLWSTYLPLRNYAEAELAYTRISALGGYSFKPWLYVLQKGNTEKSRKFLQGVSENIETVRLSRSLAELDFLDGNYQMALNRLPVSWNFIIYFPRDLLPLDTAAYFLLKARIYGLLNNPKSKQLCSDSARVFLQTIPQTPSNAPYIHAALGLLYAGLGRKEEAIRQGKRGVELLPVSKDAYDGPILVTHLAAIYVMVGDYNAAIDQLEYLVSVPSLLSIPLLRLDPTWAPLRNHPRFKKLVAEKN